MGSEQDLARQDGRSEMVSEGPGLRGPGWWFRYVYFLLTALVLGFFVAVVIGAQVSGALGSDDLDPWLWRVLIVGAGIGAAAVMAWRKLRMAGPRLPDKRPRPRSWRRLAMEQGVIFGLGIALASWLVAAALLTSVLALLHADSPIIVSVVEIVVSVGSLALGIWAFRPVRDEYLDALKAWTPPYLQRAHMIRQRAAEFERLAYEVTVMADELEAMTAKISEQTPASLREAVDSEALAKMDREKVATVLRPWTRQQLRSQRRSLIINVVVALVFLGLGLILQQTPNEAWNTLRTWLPF